MSKKNAKDRALRWGLRAEFLAGLALQLKGYRILDRRYRTPLGEIDLLAKRGSTLAVVEVKARPTHQQALEAVTYASQIRITRAAGLWLSHHPRYASSTIRYDIVAVSPGRWPLHVISAFEARER